MDKRTSSLLPGGECLLDLGCGDGGALDIIGHRYTRAIGLDINQPPSADRFWRYVRADLDCAIPVRSSSVDALHANQVIEHIRNPLAFMAEAHRVLRSGGVFVATTPNVRYLRHVWRLLVQGHGPRTSERSARTTTDWDDGHIQFFTPSDLDWIGRRAGFNEIHVSALVERSGQLGLLRRLLDHFSTSWPVRSFCSGNILFVAVKREYEGVAD
jgi:SAM-dependent methyltransferase